MARGGAQAVEYLPIKREALCCQKDKQNKTKTQV
jgi:hypothetical protein